jgi:hypothetical protein
MAIPGGTVTVPTSVEGSARVKQRYPDALDGARQRGGVVMHSTVELARGSLR